MLRNFKLENILAGIINGLTVLFIFNALILAYFVSYIPVFWLGIDFNDGWNVGDVVV